MRVLLGDQKGQVKAELKAGSIGNIVWRLNSAGAAMVQIKRGAAAFRRDLLEPGARLYVEFDNGLPAWGGVLDLPRTWHSNLLEIKAYTIERLLKFSMTSKSRAFNGNVVGSIFSQVLQEADQRAALGLTIGTLWTGGAVHYPRYHFRDMMWVINNSVRQMETCDYRIVPYLADNYIRFRAELHEQVGEDKRNSTVLIEGANVASATLTEQGTIINRVAGVGSGSTWAERIPIWGVEDASRQRYGLRETMLAPSGLSQDVTLDRIVDNAIRDNAYPHTLAALTVADIPPARFSAYGVGDVVRVQLPTYGFEGYDAPMRIIARGFDPSSGVCELVCDERFDYYPVIHAEDEYQPGEGD
jgi:hypothetical protein